MAEPVRNRVAPPPKPRELHVEVEQPKVNRITEALGQHADEHRPWGISDMDVLAEAIRAEAIDQAKLALPDEERPLRLESLLGRPAFARILKEQLAQGVAATIGASDARVQAVFGYDLESPLIHLLVLVARPSAGLEAFIDSLDRSLALSMQDLRLPEFYGRERLLDASLITPQDVRLGLGVAALLSSVVHTPDRLWQR
ncbi:MAG: hypothetical protein H6Q86_5141 [candidate division NC10 bacterium]|jgi:hypothetical protein|nr:hypothetical protein [candidate division NC10 bacterium]